MGFSNAAAAAATTTTTTTTVSIENKKYQGIDVHSFGMRILKKQGWREGTGLGPNKSGLKKHLHASRREHNSGLGTDRRDTTGVVGADWTRNAKNFESVLKGLEDYTKKEDFDEDDEDGSKGGGGDKKKDKKEKKKKRKKEEEEKAEEDVPERPRSAVGHAGRYHKREREKMREYSYDDLNAILGGGAFGGLEEVRANHDSDDDRKDSDASNDRKKVDDDDIREKDDDDDDGKRKKKKSSKKEKKNKKSDGSKKSDKEGSPSDEMMTTKFTFPRKPRDWWGHAFGFCQEGCGKDSDGYNATGNNDAMNENKDKLGFTEDEQIELFERAHLTATTKSSHRGLGLSSSGKEVGHDFEGTKVALDHDVVPEDDEDERKAKKAPWSSLAKKLLKKSGNDGKLDADAFWQKLMKKALDGNKPENATVWDDAMRWTIRRDGKFIVGYDFVTLCK